MTLNRQSAVTIEKMRILAPLVRSNLLWTDNLGTQTGYYLTGTIRITMGSAANPDYFRQVTGVRTKQSLEFTGQCGLLRASCGYVDERDPLHRFDPCAG